jgi:hypothetical protein
LAWGASVTVSSKDWSSLPNVLVAVSSQVVESAGAGIGNAGQLTGRGVEAQAWRQAGGSVKVGAGSTVGGKR